MTFRHVLILALVGLSLAGCRRRSPADTPMPVPAVGMEDAARERARADSIAAAEADRLSAQRASAAEAARVREMLTDLIYFEYDSEQLTAETQDRLREKAAILRANPGVRLRVEGHADERGSTEYNLALGQRRAESVRTFLGGYGISEDRFNTISYGKERPLVEGTGEAAWARNRRAEFAVMAGEVVNIPAEVR
ncbi:MAG: peptidoglycan-associated lipoprotein Pal [Gemmatimonadetes bacterium]|nr:peptidoglycan-associated lipoprotein Pal [Gemmatimonadota bacterium]